MKRSGAPARRKRLTRRAGIKRAASRRAGFTRQEREELDRLHREVVMLRAGAKVQGAAWVGKCEWCKKEYRLFCCHILPKGKYSNMRWDVENAFAGCYACHMGNDGWHKNPIRAAEWITAYRGQAALDMLLARAQTKVKTDYESKKRYLLVMRERALGGSVSYLQKLWKD